jgi:soluble lytic murein transglycosylase
MRGIGTTFSRHPAARAIIAGAAILVGTISAALAQEPTGSGNGDETAMAVPLLTLPGSVRGVALPHPLTPSDAALATEIFSAQSHGDIKAAIRETDALDSKLLLGPILADRYLGRFYTSSIQELRTWLGHYGDEPDAPAIHALLVKKLPKGAMVPPAPRLNTLARAMVVDVARHDDNDDDSAEKVPIKRDPPFEHDVIALAETGNDTQALRKIGRARGLSANYRALLRAEVARTLFTRNRDAEALDIAASANDHIPAAENVALAGFISGLAAWRLDLPELAASYFVAGALAPTASPAQHAAAAFWAARSLRQLGNPVESAFWLRQAANEPRTLYGLIARRALRMSAGIEPDRDFLTQSDVDAVGAMPAGLRAFALLQVDQPSRAEVELRTLWSQAKGNAAFSRALRLVASRAGLMSLAAQLAALSETEDGNGHEDLELPLPPLHPAGGFRIDPALVYALTRLESDFDSHAVSPAGALGLMQIMPMTARFITGNPTLGGERLHDPAFNLALGQRYVAYLAQQDGIDGDLIRILACYNAGPSSFLKWNTTIRDKNDPLIYLEAIPNPETRTYVDRALTYAWIYAARLGLSAPGLDALVAGEFPRFTQAAQTRTLASQPPRVH